MLNLRKSMQNRAIRHKLPTKSQRKKVSKYLSSGEDLILVTSIGMRYFWLNVIFLLLLPLALFYLSVFMFFGVFDIPNYNWVKYIGIPALAILLLNLKKTSNIARKRQSFTYVLTNRRCLIISGIFTRKIITAPLNRITHVTVEQSFTQRFLYNTGHLLIITAGFDQREIVIEDVASPVTFKIFLEELSSKLENKPKGEDARQEPKIRALTLP